MKNNNARSIKNKIEEIEILVNSYEIDIAIISESWVKKNEEKYYNLDNYHAVYSTREKRGGGLAIFINKTLDFNVLEISESEISYVAVKIISTNVIVCGIYNPPMTTTNEFLNFVEQKLENINQYSLDAVIVGDMNVDISKNTLQSNKLLEVYSLNGFKLFNSTTLTRTTTTGGSLIDHVISNSSEELKIHFFETPLSDHIMQTISIPTQIKIQNSKYHEVSKTKFNIDKIKSKLLILNNELYKYQDPTYLYNELLKVFEECSYTKNIKIRKKFETMVYK